MLSLLGLRWRHRLLGSHRAAELMRASWTGWRACVSQLIQRCQKLLSLGSYASPALQPASFSAYLEGLISNLLQRRITRFWQMLYLLFHILISCCIFLIVDSAFSNAPPSNVDSTQRLPAHFTYIQVLACPQENCIVHLYDGEPVELLYSIYSAMTCSITASLSLSYLRCTCTHAHT